MKKFLALLCLLSMLVGMSACAGGQSAGEDTNSGEGGNTDSTEITVNDEIFDPPTDGTLLYYENFEGKRAVNNEALIKTLDWHLYSEDDQFINGTARFKLVNHRDGKALYIENFASDISKPQNTMVRILSEDQFGYFQDMDYTVQYDLEYTEAAGADSFISLVTDFNGTFYQSFYLASSGYGYNGVHHGIKWYSMEHNVYSSAYAEDKGVRSEKTIVYKLLGEYYSAKKQPFNDVSVTIRSVHNKKTGVSVYMRVNPKNASDKAGEWILVSEPIKTTDGMGYYNDRMGDGAIALRIDGEQNGYIDNITVWLGNGEEPEDKSSYLLKDTECHKYVQDEKGEKVCMYCGGREKNNWELSIAPEYKGGVLSERFEYGGACTVDPDMLIQNEAKVQVVGQTTAEEFESYLGKLNSSKRFKKDYYRKEGNNIYAGYRNLSGARIYAYYFGAVSEARIIEDGAASPSAQEFGYVYDKKPGDTTVIYQYGLNMNVPKEYSSLVYNGILNIIKTADNSLIVMDGGNMVHFDDAQSEHLISFMREITGTPEGQKVRISAWMISHGHGDHFSGFCLFLKRMSGQIEIERLMYNFPSLYSSHACFAAGSYNLINHAKYVEKYIGADCKYYKPRTGEIINIADVELQVLFSHEDLYSAVTGKPENGEYNNTCLVYRVVVDGQVFLFTGDINRPSMECIIKNQPHELLVSGALQASHHLINDLRELYDIAKPSIVFAPTNRSFITSVAARREYLKHLETYCGTGNVMFENDGTYGIAVENGKFKVVYKEEKIYGKGYTGWQWGL